MLRYVACVVLCVAFFLPVPSRAQVAGQLNYDYSDNRYEFFNGTQWRRFMTGLGLASCSGNPRLDFDQLLSYYSYCNGTVWVPITGALTLNLCSKTGAMDFFNSSYHYCNGLVWVDMQGGPG